MDAASARRVAQCPSRLLVQGPTRATKFERAGTQVKVTNAQLSSAKICLRTVVGSLLLASHCLVRLALDVPCRREGFHRHFLAITTASESTLSSQHRHHTTTFDPLNSTKTSTNGSTKAHILQILQKERSVCPELSTQTQ